VIIVFKVSRLALPIVCQKVIFALRALRIARAHGGVEDEAGAEEEAAGQKKKLPRSAACRGRATV
jgi:hypothetical protein